MRNTSSGFDLREAVDNIREAFTPRSSSPRPHGAQHRDVRTAILAALGSEPMNGQQLISAIGTKSGGAWVPTAGEVYPTLQLLTDEGLLSTQHDGERTVYALTDAGREAVAAAAATAESGGDSGGANHDGWSLPDWSLPDWGNRISGHWNERWSEHTAAVPKAGAKLAQAAAQVAQSGTREQQERAAALLDETRRKLYAILAEE